MLYQACMTLYDHPDRWDGSPSSQYEWSTQHSPKITVEIIFLSYCSENQGVESTALLLSEHGAMDGVRVRLPYVCSWAKAIRRDYDTTLGELLTHRSALVWWATY